MRNLFIFLISCFSFFNFAKAQDVVYTVKAEHDTETIRLDSILIENQTVGKTLLFKDLPNSDIYEINITKGTIQGTATGITWLEPYAEKTFTLIQNSAGRLSVNYNGKRSENVLVRVYNTIGQQLYVSSLPIATQSSLQITLPGREMYIVSFQIKGADAATFKALGSRQYSSFNVNLTDGLQAVKSNDAVSKVSQNDVYQLKSTPIAEIEDESFVQGDELMIFGFKDGYVITPVRLQFEDDESILLDSKLFSECYTNTAITIEIPTDETIDLSSYKLVSFDYSVPITSPQQSKMNLRSANSALPVVEMPVANGAGVQLISLQNLNNAVIMLGAFKGSNPELKLDAESTAFAYLILNPLFANSSPDIVEMLERQFKALPSFLIYKNKVQELIDYAYHDNLCENVDFVDLPEYRKVIYDYKEKYTIDNNLAKNDVSVEFSDWDFSDKVHYKVTNYGKRTIHMYANRQFVDKNNVPLRDPEITDFNVQQQEKGELIAPNGFIRLKSDKLDYWSTVRGTLWDSWVYNNGEIPDYFFKSETNDIEVELGEGNRLEIEVWGIGRIRPEDKPFILYTPDEKLKLALVVIDGAYSDFISPVMELMTGIETEAPPVSDGGWDFRYGTRKHALSELCYELATAYISTPENWTKLTENITNKNYLNIISDVCSFIWNTIVDEIQNDINEPAHQPKFLNLIYNTMKQVSGKTKTSDAFRAGFKNQANSLKHNLGVATKTINTLEAGANLAGSCYYAFNENSQIKSTFTMSFKKFNFEQSQIQIMPSEEKEVSILGDALNANSYIIIDNPEICTAKLNDEGNKLIITGGSIGKTTITVRDNFSGMTGKLAVSSQNQCFPDLKLAKNQITAPSNQTVSVAIEAGSGNYSVNCLPMNVATVWIEDGKVMITPRKPYVPLGSIFTIMVQDNISEQVQSLTAIIGMSVNIDSGLVAYYPFNGNANDESGNGNNGTVNGATLTADRFGNDNKAYYFNNTDITFTDNVITSLPFTVSGWFQRKGINRFWSNLGTIFTTSSDEHGSYGSPGIWLFTNTSSVSYEQFQQPQGIGCGFDLPYDEIWHFFVVIFDKSGNRFYLDGVKNKQEGIIPYDYTSSLPFTVGRGYQPWGGQNFYFIGNIDDIRVYNRALSEDEVQALYNE